MIHKVMKYYTTEPVTHYETLRDRERLVAEIEVDGQSYFLKGEKQPRAFVEKIITFTKVMREAELPFIVPEKTMDGQGYIEHEGYVFTLERKGEGDEIKRLQLSQISEIGKMLGKQHAVSSSTDFRFDSGTSWGMFGGNETDAFGEYDENELSYLDFIQNVEDEGKFFEELTIIKELYQQRRSKLESVWHLLPTGPVQGDFCPYNLLFKQEVLSTVFDYDIAGDEVLINECIGVGVFLTWHYDFKGHETPEERFETYIDAYTSQRTLADIEKEMLPHLFAIIRAFRYDRIEDGIEKVKQGKGKAFIDETIMLLQG